MARKPKNVDPLIETPAPAVPTMDYDAHARTFNRFVNMLKWFIVHMLLLMPSLYFFIVAGNSIAGMVLLFLAIAALIYGLLRNPSIRHDAARVAETRPA